MATKTFEELKQLAIQIRDEKTNKQNTATRVGTAMLEHINKLEQDYYDKTQTDEELKERDDKLTEIELNHIICYIMLNGSNVSYIGINGSKIWDDSSNPYLNKDTGEYQYYSGASGYVFVSPYIYVGCLNTFLLTIYKRSSYACVVFYDKDKNILSVINGEENVQITRQEISVPDNAIYARFCGHSSYPFSVYLPENYDKNVYLSEQAKFYAEESEEKSVELSKPYTDSVDKLICNTMLNGENETFVNDRNWNESSWTPNKDPYLDKDTGEYQYYAVSGNCFVSPYVYIGCIETFLLTIYKRSSYACVVFYDKDKNILSVINGEENVQITRQEISVPDNAVFVRLCGSYKYPFSVYLPENYDKNIYLSEQAKFYAKNAGEDVYYDASINYSSTDNPISKINDSPGMTAIFHEIAFIGDSLSHGLFWDKYGWEGTNIDILGQYSWGQRLVNMFNANGANYAISGYTAKDWIEHFWDEESNAEYTSDGLEQKIKLNKKQAYCIMLGANDKEKYSAGNIETDIDLEDYNNNAQTFAGYYAGIIQRIKTIQPSAKFFVITTPKIWFPSLEEEYVEFNNIIRKMPEKFSNVFLVDIAKYGKSDGEMEKYNYGSHGTVLGYQWLAYAVCTYIDYIIKNNPSEFMYVQFIGTEHDKGDL